jgi:CheY-like chemotaxis protein
MRSKEAGSVTPAATLEGLRVFVVEDEALVSMFIDDTLSDIGCTTVSIAGSLADAMQKVATLAFDAAILDVNLQGEQTFPVAELLNQKGIPFVFSTGYGNAGIPEALRCVPILQKPFLERDLKEALSAALRQSASVGSV